MPLGRLQKAFLFGDEVFLLAYIFFYGRRPSFCIPVMAVLCDKNVVLDPCRQEGMSCRRTGIELLGTLEWAAEAIACGIAVEHGSGRGVVYR